VKVACHFDPDNRRSTRIAKAMMTGINACGDEAHAVAGWINQTWADVGLAYGWAHPDVMTAYRRYVHVDLGWWDRKPEGAVLDGYHKVCVNRRMPPPLGGMGYPSDRFDRFGLKIAPWRQGGGPIILAGMSAKSAHTRGLGPQEWEMSAVLRLRAVTNRPVIYRPKPSWVDAKPIPGTLFSKGEAIEAVLAGAWALVTLHSNAAIDALLAGVPIHVDEGPAALFSTKLEQIESPRTPDGREQLMADIAWHQFSVPEMETGVCWKHVREQIQ